MIYWSHTKMLMSMTWLQVLSSRCWISQQEILELRSQLHQAAVDSLETATIMDAQERLLHNLQGVLKKISSQDKSETNAESYQGQESWDAQIFKHETLKDPI